MSMDNNSQTNLQFTSYDMRYQLEAVTIRLHDIARMGSSLGSLDQELKQLRQIADSVGQIADSLNTQQATK